MIHAQNIYPKKLDGCNTERFALESDTIVAKIEDKKLISLVSKNFTEKERNKVIGFLKIQVIAYTDKSSCMISYENITNKTDDELNIEGLKKLIDEQLIWGDVKEAASPLIRLRFRRNETLITRYGFNANKGMHELKK